MDTTPIQQNHSYHIASEADLLETFRLKDQRLVVLPKHIEYPMDIPYYFTWFEPSGTYTYIVFKRPNWETPRGLVFRRNPSYQATSNLCDWCHSYGSSEEIGMMTVRVSSELTIGQYLCTDLTCLTKLEDQISGTGKNFDTLADQLCGKIARFYERTILAPKEK